MKVPFVDLQAQYRRYQQSIDEAISAVIQTSGFIGGETVRRFEREFAEAHGAQHCVSCANGTDAIYIVLRMLGVGSGDEVITTAGSWISTSETITQAGATPVFVDVDDFYCIDVEQVSERITKRTKAIIAVHLYGQAAQVDQLADLCGNSDIFLIEDCAQAHFAQRLGRYVGLVGRAATFSFYPGKNLGAYGDAGAIITDNAALAERCRMYANHGALVKHHHKIEGINSRLDGIQAAVLLAKLPHIHQWTQDRQRIAQAYKERLKGITEIELPNVRSGSTHVYHLFVVKARDRDALRADLASRGIETGIHYPTALPLLEAYRYLNVTADEIPRAARNSAYVLSLPIYPELSDSMIDYVVESIREFYR